MEERIMTATKTKYEVRTITPNNDAAATVTVKKFAVKTSARGVLNALNAIAEMPEYAESRVAVIGYGDGAFYWLDNGYGTRKLTLAPVSMAQYA
jgi:hypothetical protein